MSEERSYSGLRFWTLFIAGLSFVALVLLVCVVVIHAANPDTGFVVLLYPLFYIFAGSVVSSVMLGVAWVALRHPSHRKTLLILVLITTGLLAAHFYTINSPPTSSCYDNTKDVDGCVMDEIYYVPAAQAILSGEKCGPYADNCNLEHPFLAKALIGAGIVLFGNNDFGWRFSSVVLGTACIPILFAICWRITKDSTLSLFAAFLLAFETLFFIHSSIAVIDVQEIFFALCAFMVYLCDIHIWKVDRFVLAGILLGLSALSKETAILMVVFLVVYNAFFGFGSKRFRVLASLEIFVVTALVFAVGLQVYVMLFGNGDLHSFVDDVRYILSYGSGLKGVGWTDAVFGTPITPYNWMTYFSAVGYFITRVLVNGTPKYVSLGYWGEPNFFEIWLTYLWVPYVLYLGIKRWMRSGASGQLAPSKEAVAGADLSVDDAPLIAREQHTLVDQGSDAGAVVTAATPGGTADPSFRLATFSFMWFAFTYFPYFAIYYYGRVTYPFYILPALPAIAMGCAYVLSRRWFPREIAYIVLAGVFLWFFLFYPDKSFLPTWLRIILGH